MYVCVGKSASAYVSVCVCVPDLSLSSVKIIRYFWCDTPGECSIVSVKDNTANTDNQCLAEMGSDWPEILPAFLDICIGMQGIQVWAIER